MMMMIVSFFSIQRQVWKDSAVDVTPPSNKHLLVVEEPLLRPPSDIDDCNVHAIREGMREGQYEEEKRPK